VEPRAVNDALSDPALNLMYNIQYRTETVNKGKIFLNVMNSNNILTFNHNQTEEKMAPSHTLKYSVRFVLEKLARYNP
jgi:hypothetical protein